jgi:hypothetical protein
MPRRASSAMIPPSPRLSARRIKIQYLIEMMMKIDQRMRDSTPMTTAGEKLALLPAAVASLKA